MSPRVGLVGLGPMGRGLALNFLEKKVGVDAWDKDPGGRAGFHRAIDTAVDVHQSLQAMVGALEPPRCILISIPSGDPVDQVLEGLAGHLEPGDVVVDCGNSYYRDTDRRERRMADSGLHYLGLGISGGPEGARRGPAIMAGGSRSAWARTRLLFEAIAAKAGDQPCCQYFGEGGAGHFVKMVHNGIEYAVMHLLMEAYGVLERACGFGPDEIASVFQALDSGPTAGYLTATTSRVAAARSPQGGPFLIDLVDDSAGQKGTGQWTVQTALELGVAVPTLAEAVMSRSLSRSTLLREEPGQTDPTAFAGRAFRLQPELETLLPDALSLAFASAFAQGLTLFPAADAVFGQTLDRGSILRVWRRGCILRGEMVERLLSALSEEPQRLDLLNAKTIRRLVENGMDPLRRLVSGAVMAGVPGGGLASSLAYAETLSGTLLPMGLIQLQRDFFGRHGLVDKETGQLFHGPWADEEVLP